jgi:tetratricopeptide (TPR) repeat protein
MLKPRKRITKKELKQDQLVTFYYEANAWIEKNLKYVTAGALALLVVLVIGVLISNSNKKAGLKASVELTKAVRIFESGDTQAALSLLNTIVKDYGSTQSGRFARYYLANAFYKNQDYDNALTHYKKFAASFNGDQYLHISALAGVASCLEQKQEYAQAAESYEKIVDKNPKIFNAALYLLKAAQCYTSAGNATRSVEPLDKIIKDYPDAPEKSDAVFLKAIARAEK